MATPNIQRVQQPSIAPLFSRIGEVFGQIEEAANESEGRRLQMETAAKLNDVLVTTRQEEQSPDVYASFASSRIEEVRKNALAQASNDRVRKRMEDYLAPVLLKAQTETKFVRREKQLNVAKGNSVLIIDQAKRDISGAIDPLKRQEIERDIDENLTMMVQAGVHTPAEAAKLMVNFRHDADRERASLMVEQSPEWVRDNATAEHFPKLGNEELAQVKRRAESRIKEKEVEARRQQKEAMDQSSLELLNGTAQSGANLAAYREQVLRRTDLDFDTKKFWIDRLDKAVEERDKKREGGESDPFRKSDSATLGRVFKTILEDPDKISSTEISGLIGRGLSVNDALRAANMVDSRQKAAAQGQGPTIPATMDPLNMAFKNWERLRSQMAFIPEDDRIKNDPNAQSMNDTRATELWQTVVDRVMANPQLNPQTVLNETMQPFYEQKVEGFFSRGIGVVTAPFRAASPSQDERIAARRELARRGIETSEDNISKVIERARSRQPATEY